ncbi:MAG: hypothetical protein PVF74_07225 [Anaerolineales bacterium]|jgi:hypothetical protein
MTNLLRSIFLKNDQDFSDIEGQLESTFWRVSPSERYVGELRNRLIQQMKTLPTDSTVNAIHLVLILLAGILSSFLIVIVSIRVMVTLITALGLLYQYRRQIQEKRIDTIPPAV